MATIPTGRFVWFDYISKDDKKAQAFYGELFHWKTKDVKSPDGSTYTLITLDGDELGGYMGLPEGAPPHAHWLTYLQVTSAQETCTKIRSLGGKVRKDPTKVGDVGTFAVVADPLDGTFALWQPGKPEGSGDYKNKPNTWCWNELMTADPARSVQFYAQIGGFTEEKMESGMGAYHILKADGQGRAGVMKAPPGVPQSWMPYVHVTSADQTHDQAKRLGATIRVPPTDIPNIGRFSVVQDPNGAVLGVLQPFMPAR